MSLTDVGKVKAIIQIFRGFFFSVEKLREGVFYFSLSIFLQYILLKKNPYILNDAFKYYYCDRM